MNTEITVITKVAHDLLKLQQQQATGKLVIAQGNHSEVQWQLYFYLGRLVFATGGAHSVRRWYRAFRQHCPECYQSGWLTTVQPHGNLWEADVLNQAIQQGQITALQAKAVVQSMIHEIVFEFVEQKTLETSWHPGQPIAQQTVFLSVEQVIQAAQKLREEWRSAGLGNLQMLMPQFSPNLAPVIKNPGLLAAQTSPTVSASLSKLMQGHKTLWDVAIKMKRPLSMVIRSLLPLIRQGVIALEEVADFPSPYPVFAVPEVKFPQSRGLIACIDDSPVIGQTLEQILKPLGYDVLTILNPLQGITTLLERKPDLIFLDLVMPNTNGYELCTFLRKTSAFQQTPIVILTGHDGVIDRVRAKMVGSSEFLAKPPERSRVLQVVQKFLGEPDFQPDFSAASAVFSSSLA